MLLSLLAIVGCVGPSPTSVGGTSSAPSSSPGTAGVMPCPEMCCYIDFECPADVVVAIDADGQTVSPGATITARFDDSGATLWCGPYDQTITVEGVSGQTLVADDGWSATFVPDAPLPAGTTFEATASAQLMCGTSMCVWDCDGARSATFATLPPTDPALLVGRSYVVRWDDVTLSTPTDASALDPADDLILQIRGVDASSGAADTIVVSGSPLAPDCSTAVARDADLSANPLLAYAGDVEVTWDAAPLTFEGLALTGTVSADGGELAGLRLSARVATEAFGGADCPTVAASLGGTCVACASSASGQCLQVEGVAATAAADPSVDLAACGP